ncbi:MAG: Hsp70 family protein [Bdellovibrionales bacterium]|nr:Hsp70 family protein [Bdellovibrionales bacterium]
MKDSPRAIGIDYGTSNTVAAALDANGSARVLKLDPGAGDGRLLKSLIYFPERNKSFFGKSAIDQYFDLGMEGRFLQSIKRLLPNPDFTGTSLFGKHAGIEDLIARFLQELRTRIEAEIGEPLGKRPVIFGRPARYSQDPAREGLAVVRFKRAIELAGFDLDRVRLVEEPVAAMIAGHRSERAKPEDGNGPITLIADLGGGTSDFTLFRRVSTDVQPEGIHTFAVHGISVAGDALDSDFFVAKLQDLFGASIRYQRPFSSNVLTMPTLLVKHLPKWHHHAFLRERATWNFILVLRKELVDEKQKPLLENLITLVEENLGYRLHVAVEDLKLKLSQENATDFAFKSYPIDLGFPVTRPAFETIISPSVEDIGRTALETCRIGKVKPEEVERLQFTGGTSKVPAIREDLAKRFPNAKLVDQDTFTAVAEGLALYSESIPDGGRP